jgi:hypothetical protein
MDVQDASLSFDAERPGGIHRLDLSDPYQRAVLVALCLLVATREGVTFVSFRHSIDGPDREGGQELVLKRSVRLVDRGAKGHPSSTSHADLDIEKWGGGDARMGPQDVKSALEKMGLQLAPQDLAPLLWHFHRGLCDSITTAEFRSLCIYLRQKQLDVLPKVETLTLGTLLWLKGRTGYSSSYDLGHRVWQRARRQPTSGGPRSPDTCSSRSLTGPACRCRRR